MRRYERLAVAVIALVLAGCGDTHARTRAPPSAVGTTRVADRGNIAPPKGTSGRSSSPATRRATRHLGAIPGTTVVATLISGGVRRSYRLHAPASLDDSTVRLPLVIVLHGASGNAARVELRYHWDPLSDRERFFVAYPQGVLDQWNASLTHGVDDVSFLATLIAQLERTLPVDSRRIFVAGMSNGGAMAYRVGCALSDQVAAIAPVEAPNPGCRPSRPISMVAVHGLADSQVSFASAQQSVAAWRTFDGCPADPQIERTGPVTRQVWPSCAAGTSVALYAVANSGHEWPGSSPPLPGHDRPSPDLDATQVIWTFFEQHHS